MTNTNDAMLTLALHHCSNLKVQTALIEGNRERAREYLKDYMEGSLEDSDYLDDIEDHRLTPHERAARNLNALPGPLLLDAFAATLERVLPLD